MSFYRCRLLHVKYKIKWTPNVDLDDRFTHKWGKSGEGIRNDNIWGKSPTAVQHTWGK